MTRISALFLSLLIGVSPATAQRFNPSQPAGGASITPNNCASAGQFANAIDGTGKLTCAAPPTSSFGYQGSYPSGQWVTLLGEAYVSGSAYPNATTMKCSPGFVAAPLSIKTMGGKFTTAATGNFAMALYASSATTGRPTGTPIASTGTLSSNASLNSAAVSANLPVGAPLWECTQVDNTTAILVGSGPKPLASATVGAATQNTLQAGSTAGFVGVSYTVTFGTFPDLTSASPTELTSGTVPVIQMQVQ